MISNTYFLQISSVHKTWSFELTVYSIFLHQAIVKAMLTSPTCDANGYSNLLTASDVSSLRSSGSNRVAAAEAHTWIIAAEQFLAAYGTRIDPVAKSKLISSLEVRAAMHIQDKKSDTRASFSSLAEIARQFYVDCKKHDQMLPVWTKLPAVEAVPKASDPKGVKGGLREISGSMVHDSLLSEKGFTKEQVIYNIASKDKYEIKVLNANMRTVTCELYELGPDSDKKKTEKTIEVDRIELLNGSTWQHYKVVATVFLTNIADPLANFELKASVLQGLVKNALALEFSKSSESDCTLQTSPDLKVLSSKGIKKEGSFKLVGLTSHVSVYPAGKEVIAAWKCTGEADGFKVYCKSSNIIPSTSSHPSSSHPRDSFVIKCWCVRATFDQSQVNCVYDTKDVEVTLFGTKVKIGVPMILSTKPIPDECEVVVLKRTEPDPVVEPVIKKPKLHAKAQAGPKNSPKGKGKWHKKYR